jgi:hypothetical protein
MSATHGVIPNGEQFICIVSADPAFRHRCRSQWPAAAIYDASDRTVRAIGGTHPGLILYDLVHSDEWRHVTQLRELPSAKEVPMIVLTSWVWADGFSRRRARELGCMAVLRKPCPFTTLVEVLERLSRG